MLPRVLRSLQSDGVLPGGGGVGGMANRCTGVSTCVQECVSEQHVMYPSQTCVRPYEYPIVCHPPGP